MPATILVADDESFIVDLLAEVLEDEGHRVVRAYNGAEARERVERDRPDLILTDNMMPRLSGLELIAWLHGRPDLAVPVILMSAVTPIPAPPPPTHFLPKPFDLEDVLARVAQLLARA